MESKLVDFIGRLASDPRAQEMFAADASTMMRKAGMSDDDARQLKKFCDIVCKSAPTYLGGGDTSDGGD